MSCAECEAFEKAYHMARENRASVAASLQKAKGVEPGEYRKLTIQAKVAKGVCLMAKEALRVHKEGHKKPA